MVVQLDLTKAEWSALAGWVDVAQHNWEDALGTSQLDAVAWAESQSAPIPNDVDDQDAAGEWVYFERMKARIKRRRPTLDDLYRLYSYGEGASYDEVASKSADRRAWEKVYSVIAVPGAGGPPRSLLTEREFRAVLAAVGSRAEDMRQDYPDMSDVTAWDSASELVAGYLRQMSQGELGEWSDNFEAGPSILEVGTDEIAQATGFGTYEEYVKYRMSAMKRSLTNPKKTVRPLTEDEFSEVFGRVESTAEGLYDDGATDSVEDGWDSASEIVSAEVSDDVDDWVDFWELSPSLLEVGSKGINNAVGFTTYKEYRDYVGKKRNPRQSVQAIKSRVLR